MRVDSDKRILYHITTKDCGEKVRLIPRTEGEFRSVDEPNIPRICVSENVSGCMVAVYPCIDHHLPVRVYRTDRRMKAHIPELVVDSGITREKWILKSVQMVLFGTINQSVVPDEFSSMILDLRDPRTSITQKKYYRMFRDLEEAGELIIP